MDTEFRFDQKQLNTLKVSGLAAYVQRPPRDRVGWVHARGVWLPEWRPKKWAYQVQRIEVTLESLGIVEEHEARQFYFEPWKLLMLTAYESFLTDDSAQIEMYFSRFTDRPEFVHHPDRVNCPHEYADEELSDEPPARWSLIRRAWVALLLCLQESGREVVWAEAGRELRGSVGQVRLDDFELKTQEEIHVLRFEARYGVHLSTVHADGYVQHLWQEPTLRTGLDPATLPIWSSALGQWVRPHEVTDQE